MFALCITTHNRFEMLVESFERVMDDARISEIVISDDCSEPGIYDKLNDYCQGKPKIRLFRNERNVGMSLNKKLAIERSTKDWCILLDSDNRLNKEYLDALAKAHRYPNVINVPDQGSPKLDYRRFAKWYISRSNIKYFLGFAQAEMLLNTCNYAVHRETYLSVYEYNADIKGSDTIWFNYLWLRAGGAFIVVPGMRYYHRIHTGSGFMKDLDYNVMRCKQIAQLMKELP